MRIGIVDLDTSHPANWIPIERELGHKIVGLCDSGDVHPPEYAAEFAQKLVVPKVYDSIAQLVPDVDCAILHGCNWDAHIERARPFIEAGKAVLVDKPVAGRGAHLEQVLAWSKAGARLTGGSSLRFCHEVRDWLARPGEERGSPHTVFCGCGVDEFNYGIHAYSMLCGIMGPGIVSVQHLSSGPQRRIRVSWKDGRTGFLVLGKSDAWQPFHASIVTNKGVTQILADPGKLYRALLEVSLPYLAGLGPAPIPVEDLLEAEYSALAARTSWLNNDREVAIEEIRSARDGYDGTAFAVQYRRERYPADR